MIRNVENEVLKTCKALEFFDGVEFNSTHSFPSIP